MRLLMTFSIVLLLIIYSATSIANESKAIQATYNNAYPNLVINNASLNQELLGNELITAPFDSTQTFALTSQLKGEFKTPLLWLKAGMVESKQTASWNKYYLQGSVILHQHNDLNVSLMANIEQTNSFYHYNRQALQLKSPIEMSNTETNYSYGIVGRYDINSAWQFSGGIIHAAPLNESIQNIWYGDTNMALLGTSYSF